MNATLQRTDLFVLQNCNFVLALSAPVQYYNAQINLVFFFETPKVDIIVILCITSNGNKLEIVANRMNLKRNLGLS